jgi:hypothetical protein
MWGTKFAVCIAVDLFDFTIGRLLFPVPFVGEVIGCAICASMFGWGGVFYGLEAIDFTEQVDGFIPTTTIIALANKPQ